MMKANFCFSLLTLAFLLASCMSSTPDHRFFLLSATVPQQEQTQDNAADAPGLWLQSVSLPEYLNQNEMVMRLPSGELKKTGVFWGQNLNDGIKNVVTENLGNLLGAAKVAVGRGDKSLIRLQLHFLELAVTGQGALTMRGVCQCQFPDGTSRQFPFAASQACGSSPESQVKAHNQLLADLSRRIVTFLNY
jgi:uncharacterized lipoprotein YmbA